MAKSKAHLDNFKSVADHRFAIIDVTSDAVYGTRYHEFASGKSVEQAKERFYNRFMFREMDREMMNLAQKHNRLILVERNGAEMHTVEYNLVMLAAF